MTAVAWGHDVDASLQQAFFMFWQTLWPLVFGFGASGLVQAFVPRDAISRSLGTRRPAAILRATGYGMASSSCSYAASAMARSLFAKGADFVTAMVFMFASTNLVIELGVVLAVLLGWQFAVAEFAGGPIMIALLALTGGWVLNQRLAARLRARVGGEREHQPTSVTSSDDVVTGHLRPDHRPTKSEWSTAARYTMADLKMLRRELAIGYLVAGVLAVAVPNRVWNGVFLHGHGFWTSLENVIVGPFVALISFVCSIGNVPLAAALWKGGISFGGVISFLFADLITFPLLLVYRKYYGTRVALRLLVWFWAVMSVAGLVVEALAHGVGLIAAHRPTTIVGASFHWDATTYLNLAALALFVLLFWLSRQRDGTAADSDHAIDPVCGMQVQKSNTPATLVTDGQPYWFCSDGCQERFSTTVEPAPRVAGTMSTHG